MTETCSRIGMLPGCWGSIKRRNNAKPAKTARPPKETLDEDFDLRNRDRLAAVRGKCHRAARLGLSAGRRDRRTAAAGNRRTQARAGQHADLYAVTDRRFQRSAGLVP